MANEHVLVVGAGQMGAGIAQVALTAGLRVTLVDVAKEAVDKGAGRIRAGLGQAAGEGQARRARREARRSSRLTTWRRAPARSKDVDVAIEAATENEELKRRIFQELDAGGAARAACWPPTPRPFPSPASPRRRSGPRRSSGCTS